MAETMPARCVPRTLRRCPYLEFALFPQSLDLRRQAPEVDEAGGLGLVVVALPEGHQVLGIEGVGGGGPGGDDIALVELQLHAAGDVFVSLVSESLQGLPQGAEPLAVVDEVGKIHRQLLLLMEGVLIHGEHLQLPVGGANGIGLLDIVENRLVGMKDRGVYETPGGTILYAAHKQLEMLTVDKDTLHEKQKLAVDFADLIYNGKWFSPLREALQAFADEANKYVTGSVKLKLYKGNILPAGVTSPCSLYSEKLVTFGESDYDQAQAAGFINLWGLPTKVQALREQGKL